VKFQSRVKLDSRFREVGRHWELAAAAGLKDAAQAGAQVSEQVAGKRRRSGTMADIKVGPVKRSRRGNWYVTFYSLAWYARFHERGTVHIKPLRFLRRGRTAARKVLLDRIERRMRRVR
jgi:HK97 gp10 family phage protein